MNYASLIRSLESGRRKAVELADACTARRSSKISRRSRRSLDTSNFALPSKRKYPIPDAYHAKLALIYLLRIAGRDRGKPEDAKQILRSVRRKWPHVYRCESDLVHKIKRKFDLR